MAKKKTEAKAKEEINDTTVNETVEQEIKDQESTEEATSEDEAAEPAEIIIEEDPTAKLEEELSDWKDKYLRLSAEFDNYRRRTLKEKMDLTKTAGENIFIKILPIVDDFERAKQSMSDAKDCDAILQGVDLIYTKFKEFLAQQGVKEIEAMHAVFDTDIHEAITKIPAPKKKLKGKVVDVVEKGFMLNDKVIRFPKVVVGE